MDIVLGLAFSLHLGFEGEYNDIHPHFRLQQDNIIGGVYYNSEENLSSYIGYVIEQNDFALEIGAVTGYEEMTVAPYARATYKNFYFTPGVGEDTGIVIGYEFKFK